MSGFISDKEIFRNMEVMIKEMDSIIQSEKKEEEERGLPGSDLYPPISFRRMNFFGAAAKAMRNMVGEKKAEESLIAEEQEEEERSRSNSLVSEKGTSSSPIQGSSEGMMQKASKKKVPKRFDLQRKSNQLEAEIQQAKMGKDLYQLQIEALEKLFKQIDNEKEEGLSERQGEMPLDEANSKDENKLDGFNSSPPTSLEKMENEKKDIVELKGKQKSLQHQLSMSRMEVESVKKKLEDLKQSQQRVSSDPIPSPQHQCLLSE